MAAIPKLFGTETEYGFSMQREFHRFLRENRAPHMLVEQGVEALGIPAFGRHERRPAFLDRLPLPMPPFWGTELDPYSRVLKETEEILERQRGKKRRPPKREEVILESTRILGLSGLRLSNGARFYVDMGHPEYSTPECISARDVVTWQRAGDLIAEAGRKRVEEALRSKLDVYKDNSDRGGREGHDAHSFAAHENYCVEPGTFRELITPFSARGHQLETFFVTRQIFAGAGKVGSEDLDFPDLATYQLSQRADFILRRWDRDTTYQRAIINMRDMPYADPKRFRRLHVIVGDANICESALWLKVGITAMVLKMIEDDFLAAQHSVLCSPLRNAVRDIKRVSRDLSVVSWPLTFESGRRMSALNIQWEFYELLEQYFSTVQEPSVEEQDLLQKYRYVLGALEHVEENPGKLLGYCDWVTKYVLMQELLGRGVAWTDERMRTRDMRYHHINPEIGLWAWLERRGIMQRVTTDEEIRAAVFTPPSNTRAYLRGMCVEKFSEHLDSMGWQTMDFMQSSADEPSLSAWLGDPFVGTKEAVDPFLKKDDANLSDLRRLLEELGLPPDGPQRSYWSRYDD